MLASPGVQVSIRAAPAWSAEGPLAERALEFARKTAKALSAAETAAFHVIVEESPEAHVGLGTGTQLGLAVARAIAMELEWTQCNSAVLARLIGRGRRSALGVHGFEQGGFLVDGGKMSEESVAPLLARQDFPDEWRVILLRPPWPKGRHGREEQEVFDGLQRGDHDESNVNRLCRLVLLHILPALADHNWSEFSEAITEYNRLSGVLFAGCQDGVYSDPRTADLVDWLRRQGIAGAGQSSWGPTVFGFARDQAQAEKVVDGLRVSWPSGTGSFQISKAMNAPAKVKGELEAPSV